MLVLDTLNMICQSKIIGWLVGDWDGKFQKYSERILKKMNPTFLPKSRNIGKKKSRKEKSRKVERRPKIP